MLEIFQTQQGSVKSLERFQAGAWVNMVRPSKAEIEKVASHYKIDLDDVMSALDMEESSRITYEEGYTLILIDIPITEVRHGSNMYTTIPLGILLTEATVITICWQETSILRDFIENRIKEFSTKKQMRFIYQILLNSAILYQRNLRAVDRMRIAIEERVSGDVKDEDLIELHELESSLVYFATSLRQDSLVLQRLVKSKNFGQYPEDEDILEDANIEYQQAIEMTSIYRDVIDGTRELLSSIIDNRLNNVMKYLTSITLVMAIPTVISGLYGMNVGDRWVPLANIPYGFAIICVFIFICCIVAYALLKKKKML